MVPRTCKNCIYAVKPQGRAKPDLICINKAGYDGQLFYTEKRDSCRNFRAPQKIDRPIPPDPPNDKIKYIPLTKGKFAIVDAEDYPWLSKHKWYAIKSDIRFYAYRAHRKRNISMHRQIMNAPKNMFVDHIDGNSLNNTKANLRLATSIQNTWNRRKYNVPSRSKFKGTVWVKKQKWQARICINGKRLYLGSFNNEADAARAYDKKAAELFGQFAYLNFPQ